MRTVFLHLLTPLLLLGATPTFAQLPPDILADSYLLRVEQAIRDGDQTRARAEINKIILLQRKQELNLSEEFHFRYAKSTDSVGLPEQTVDSIMKYLAATGREGKHYVEALELMNHAQDEIEGRNVPESSSIEPTYADVDFGRDSLSSHEGVEAMSCEEWNTAAYYAAATLDHVTACLSIGADPEAMNESKITPLHFAAGLSESSGVIEALIAAGADLEAMDEDGETPLHFAARLNETPAVAKALIVAGANPKAKDQGKMTPLHFAAMSNNNPAVIQALIVAGADLDVPDKDGDRPLNLADVYNNNPAVASALISAGSNLRARERYKWTSLHRAAKFNADPTVIEALISAGSDPHARDKYKRTPLHEAARFNENPAVLEALIAAGANLEAKDKNEQRPLHEAASSNDNPAVIEVLIAAGADVKARCCDLRSYTPLHAAARSNDNLAVIEALLNAGSDPKSRSFHGTPLHLAAVNSEDPAVISALLDAGGDLNRRTSSFMDKMTPLHDAAKYNQTPAIIKFLLDAGADLEARNKQGFTPLALAAENNGNPSVVKALLDAGANLRTQTNKGFTSFALATEHNENPAVREILLAAGAGQIERQIAAAEARRDAQAGPGLFDVAVGVLGGTAIAAAGGGTEEAVEAGTVFAESVIRGGSPGGSAASVPVAASTGNVAGGEDASRCEISGYPSPPGGLADVGLPWCPASVDFQVRAFALQAAGIQCAVHSGTGPVPRGSESGEETDPRGVQSSRGPRHEAGCVKRWR